jgi:predicted GH43/DUF377 family glycosyl hydrolase
VPIKTEAGWLLVYSHIQNYFQPDKRIFGIEAVLLNQNDPQKIVGRTEEPLMVPEKEYEECLLKAKAIFDQQKQE